ncbi:uncharacterized protein LOC110252363 [Exaiptasia diaphana]|uniref:Uncharacterized protein n=1 Tax=Exaiptasia diaphana TaxID=2652724 RepID=A0A913Y520_EXADI|nr:uncharacterized protein LOC110252363 [Exaiptasia diaphana]
MNSLVFAVLLLVVVATVQVHGSKVACKVEGSQAKYLSDKTAKSDDFEYTTTVSQDNLSRCKETCYNYCKWEGPRGLGDPWPGCKAFSSYVKPGGTCYCYGWKDVPEWYDDSEYDGGYCEN